MSRPHTWVTDLRHYIDEQTDDWVEGLPGPARDPHTNVPCWRRPGRKRCRGDIMAELAPDSYIVWQCPCCGENGLIHDWEGTLWDRGPHVNDAPSTSTH